jgi:hypothetical protein
MQRRATAAICCCPSHVRTVWRNHHTALRPIGLRTLLQHIVQLQRCVLHECMCLVAAWCAAQLAARHDILRPVLRLEQPQVVLRRNAQRATRNMQRTTCNRQRATDNMQQTTCNRQRTTSTRRQVVLCHSACCPSVPRGWSLPHGTCPVRYNGCKHAVRDAVPAAASTSTGSSTRCTCARQCHPPPAQPQSHLHIPTCSREAPLRCTSERRARLSLVHRVAVVSECERERECVPAHVRAYTAVRTLCVRASEAVQLRLGVRLVVVLVVADGLAPPPPAPAALRLHAVRGPGFGTHGYPQLPDASPLDVRLPPAGSPSACAYP